MKTIVIKNNYGKGNSSKRLLIKENNVKYLIKITDIEEITTLHKYVPKLFSINQPKYQKFNYDNCNYIYKYQFIKGKHIDEIIIGDTIFKNLIKMFKYFIAKGYLVWDCHPGNIIVDRNKNVFFVDMGGLKLLADQSLYYPIIFKPGIEPDEWKSETYPLSLNTEQFSIYYLSNRIVECCKIKLSNKCIRILNKMNEPNTASRFKSFKQIAKCLKA